MGVFVHEMPIGAAFETYTILTVGDGLVSQIPAVIIAVGTALLLARGGSTQTTDAAVLGQLGRHPARWARWPRSWPSSRWCRGCHSCPSWRVRASWASCLARRQGDRPEDAPRDAAAPPRKASLGDLSTSTRSTWSSRPTSWT
jgi:flagellar biosynthesis protein FlhA